MNFDFQEQDVEVRPFQMRVMFTYLGILVLFLVIIGRLAWLQIINQSAYLEKAERNRTMNIVTQAPRGMIEDRNGEILAKNRLSYSLEITPDKLEGKLEDVIEQLQTVMPITTADIRRFRRLREDMHRYDSIPIRRELTDNEVAKFIAQKWRFPGVDVAQREHRIYPDGEVGSHFLGYIGSISQRDRERLKDENKLDLYESAREIGKVGIERSYEDDLHGTPGQETLEVTAGGYAVRTLSVTPPKPGKNIQLTIDMNLQRVAENAMKGHTGAVVVMNPQNGEILAFVSMPTYDPNLFPDGIDPVSWNELNTNSKKPLLNRAMRGLYPIGSTYKPFMALAGLTLGKITPNMIFQDNGVFMMGNHKFRDMAKVPKGPVDLRRSIALSSDVYYYWLAVELGVDAIHDFMEPLGFGQKTGIDLVGEQAGTLPNREWKEKRYGRPWVLGDTPSIGIGQGYNSFTLLQLANATAALANRGNVMTPHLVRKLYDPVTQTDTYIETKPKHTLNVKKSDIEAVIDGMVQVTKIGTAKAVFVNTPYEVAGKTGTAQVINISQEGGSGPIKREHQDHSLFTAFAPARNPTISVTVIAENAGFGAATAAPVTKTIMDYWLTGRNSLGLPPSPSSPAYQAQHPTHTGK